MNAKIMGNGELTLVLSHGYGGSHAVWNEVLPSLSQKYRVVVFDWSFSGAVDGEASGAFDPTNYSSLSDFSDDLIVLLDDLNLKGAVFVGHSMAGMIGCIASVKRPDLFSQLVLVAASPRYLNAEGYKGGFQREEIDNILNNIETDFQAWAQYFTKVATGANDPIAAEKFGRDLRRMTPEAALSVARMVFLSDFRDVLESVEAPCTIIQGTNDVVVPLSVGNYMQSRIKGKTALEIIKMDGHFPQLTAAQQLIDIIDRVLMPTVGIEL